ncbi:AraC family transcriptional regulator InvF [Aeromonas cavernicola]|uniref:AraC family transcriptional regulator InvF n=1 Tax=Aeromonas cavernicola TaxID=1006623 RepID=A0A2H9U7V1_9GAMM|nr:AraC family transcriptional regulator InvF [Aeromonas cavernicola]PJG60110.1 AraC family transcriptional regulator InvF [Aeromonas cavernicola]
MADHDVLNQQEILKLGCKRRVPEQDVWLLQVEDDCTLQLEFSCDCAVTSWEVNGSWLLLLDSVNVRVVNGDLPIRSLRLETLSKLLAFIDEASNTSVFETDRPTWSPLQLHDVSILGDKKRCEHWFLQQILAPKQEFRNLLALLRLSESYWLVRFLLAQSTCDNTVQELGKRYGVSYSHFRRLCRHALGSAAKAQLRDWRMARSLLDVVEGQENLTQVAIKHGYASSSHFSNEVRELLGVSPRRLSNIIQLASK